MFLKKGHSKMAQKTSWLAIAAMLFVSSPAWSDTVEDLNTHVSGDTARAADVNENFAAVKSAVDGNDALIAALEARIVALEAQAPVPGPEGPEGPQGEPGVDGADGSDAEVLHVFDVNGRDLGLLAGADFPDLTVFVPGIGEVRTNRTNGDVREQYVYFDSTDCTDQAYVEDQLSGLVVRANSQSRYFMGNIGETERFVEAPIYTQDALLRCQLAGGGIFGIPATEINPEDIGLPWPLPLYVDLAPEPAP
jgi:hypothetical protein